MNHYEAITRIYGDGEIHLSGIPLMPGTEVTVVVNPEVPSGDQRDRVQSLLAALDRGRNTTPVGPLNRDDLYERDCLR